MRLVISLVFALLASPVYASDACEGLLAQSLPPDGTGSIRKRMSELNPQLQAPDGVEALFLALKAEENRVYLGKLEPELAEHVRAQESSRYVTEGLNEFEMKLFYMNAIAGLYVRVADLWKKGEALRELGRKPTSFEDEWIGKILDVFLTSPLEDRNLSVETAEKFFRERPYSGFPWMESLEVIRNWREKNPRDEGGISEFQKYWDAEGIQLEHRVFEIVRGAIFGRHLRQGPDACCERLCVLCPRNMRWIKPRSKEPGNNPSATSDP